WLVSWSSVFGDGGYSLTAAGMEATESDAATPGRLPHPQEAARMAYLSQWHGARARFWSADPEEAGEGGPVPAIACFCTVPEAVAERWADPGGSDEEAVVAEVSQAGVSPETLARARAIAAGVRE